MKSKVNRLRNAAASRIPMFWRYLIMMLCFLLLLIGAQAISARILTESLIKRDTQKAQLDLEMNCEQLSEALFLISEVPYIIEDSVPYKTIAYEKEEALPAKYYPTINEIKNNLQSYTNLLGDYMEYAYCLPRLNVLCSKAFYVKAESDYFNGLVSWSESDGAEIQQLMDTKGTLMVLPAQEIQFEQGISSFTGITVLSHPRDTNTGILVIFREETLLRKLGFYSLPEGATLQILTQGDILLDDVSVGEAATGQCYEIKAEMAKMRMKVIMQLPESYFVGLMAESRKISGIVTAAFAGISLLLCFIFSRASSKPFKKLLEIFGKEKERPAENELIMLDAMIRGTKDRQTVIENLLMQSQLTRLFSGLALQEHEYAELEGRLALSGPYRLALLATAKDEQLNLLYNLNLALGDSAVFIVLNTAEIGGIFTDEEKTGRAFSEKIAGWNLSCEETSAEGVRCGISARFDTLEVFSRALRQARICVPEEAGLNAFAESDGIPDAKPLPWLQNGLLYQNIMNGNEAATLNTLTKAARETSALYGMGVFHYLLYVILDAASEIGIPKEELNVPEYSNRLSPADNLNQLKQPIHDFFAILRARKNDVQNRRQEELLMYIKENLQDSGLCIQQIATVFDMKEKQVREIVEAKTDMRFSEYLLDLRMKRIGELLLTTENSVNAIAQSCGYPSETTFFRLFKKYYGMTPNNYRQNQNNESQA